MDAEFRLLGIVFGTIVISCGFKFRLCLLVIAFVKSLLTICIMARRIGFRGAVFGILICSDGLEFRGSRFIVALFEGRSGFIVFLFGNKL